MQLFHSKIAATADTTSPQRDFMRILVPREERFQRCEVSKFQGANLARFEVKRVKPSRAARSAFTTQSCSHDLIAGFRPTNPRSTETFEPLKLRNLSIQLCIRN